MKVLFAVSSESISEAIIKRYQKEYKEILSYKNVYYFNAILKEIQKDKTYDRIVISEDLEPFSNNNYDTIDKFIFEKLDSISDEAHDSTGKEASIILICTDRRMQGSSILVKLFGIGVYNALLGNDRSMEQVCKLINRPRNKKEAKMYYRIDSEDVNYKAENENEVSEVEIQNILAHFKKLGRNSAKYSDSFNNIATQYTEEQLRIIVNCLPINVKAVLESNCEKYQELMSKTGGIPSVKSVMANTVTIEGTIRTEISEKKIGHAGNMTRPIVIPSAVKNAKNHIPMSQRSPSPTTYNGIKENVQGAKTAQVTRPPVVKKTVEEEEPVVAQKQEPVRRPVTPTATAQAKPQATPQATPTTRVAQARPTVSGAQSVRPTKPIQPVQQANTATVQKPTVEHTAPVTTNTTATEDLLDLDLGISLEDTTSTLDEQKTGKRGRPRKTPLNIGEEKVKGKRGRPRKIVEEEPSVQTEIEEMVLPGLDNSEPETLPEIGNDILEDETILPGFEDDTLDEATLPGFEDDIVEDDNILPGFEDDVVEDDSILQGFEDESNLLEDDGTLPGFEDDTLDEATLPGFEDDIVEDENILPGFEDESILPEDDGVLPGFEEDVQDDEATLPGLDDINLDEDILPGLDEPEIDDTVLPMGDEVYEEVDDTMLPMGDEVYEEADDTMLPMGDEVYEEVDDTLLPAEDEVYEEVDDTLLPAEDGLYDEVNDSLPGMEEVEDELTDEDYTEEVALPGLDDLDDDLLGDETLDSYSSTEPAEEYEEVYEDTGDDLLPGIGSDADASMEEETLLPGMGFEDEGADNIIPRRPEPVQQTNSESLESIRPRVDYSMSSLNSLMTKDKKIVNFIGTSKNGTSFLVNNLAALFSSLGINTAILDMTKNKNSYYIYTNNEEELRTVAYTSIEKLQSGYAEGIKVNKNLTVYTDLPASGKDYSDSEPILSTLVQNHSLILVDCDFDTDPSYFASCQELYLVQSMDILTIQPLTAFLRELKTIGVLEPEKIRVVINKEMKINNKIGDKNIIAGLAYYNDPAMSFMTELFNKDTVKAIAIPFDVNSYSKYLGGIVDCEVSLNGYSKQFLSKLKLLGDMVYPLTSKQSYNNNPGVAYNINAFSNSMNDTLSKMRKKY